MNCRPTQSAGGWWNLGGRTRKEDCWAGSRPSPFPAASTRGLPPRTVTAALNACPICHRGRQQAGFSHQAGLRSIFPSSWVLARWPPLSMAKAGPATCGHLALALGHMEQKLLRLASYRMKRSISCQPSPLEPGVSLHNRFVPSQGPGSGQMVELVWRKCTWALSPDSCSIF